MSKSSSWSKSDVVGGGGFCAFLSNCWRGWRFSFEVLLLGSLSAHDEERVVHRATVKERTLHVSTWRVRSLTVARWTTLSSSCALRLPRSNTSKLNRHPLQQLLRKAQKPPLLQRPLIS